MATMIPSSISAALSADLTYNPNVHVQTVEIDRTGTNLIQQASDNYVKWFISKLDFLSLCSLNMSGYDTSDRYTLGATAGLLLTDASDAILKFSNIDKAFTIPTTEPTIKYGEVVTDASYVGQVGATDVSYDRVLLKEDGTTAAAASATTTTWSFDQTEIELTANWSVNDSSMIAVSANPNVTLAVSKAYNDAAADFIQIKLHEAIDPHGMTTSSADDVTDSVDYASKFQTLTTGEIQSVISYPTVTVTDEAFTQACQQAINSDGVSRTIYSDEQLRDALDDAIESSALQGIQGTAPVTLQLPVTLASVAQEDMSKSLTPLVVFDPASLNSAYRLPTLTSIDGETINAGYSGKHLRSRRPNQVDLHFTKHPDSASAFHSTTVAKQISSVQYSQDGTGATKINVPLSDVTYVDNDTFRLNMIVPTNDALSNGVTFYVTTRAPDLPNGDPSLNSVETQSFAAASAESGTVVGETTYPATTPSGTVTLNSDYSHTYTFPSSMSLSEWTIQGTYTETYLDGLGGSPVSETKSSTVTVLNSGSVRVSFPVNENHSSGSLMQSVTASETFTRGDQVLSNPDSVTIDLTTTPIWNPPTSVALSQQSSLPGSTMLVVNKTVRLRFTTDSALHSNTVADVISSIAQSVDGAAATELSLAASNVVVDKDAGTVTFDATAGSAASHAYTLTLKATAGSGGGALAPLPTQTVAVGDVYTFPTSTSTTKDIAVIAVGQTLTMTTGFSKALEADLTPSVQITDLSGGSASPTATKSGSDVQYAFAVANDSNHSGVVTLAYGDVSETYQWASAGHLTHADIYTFPNLVAYDGVANGYDSGKHLKVDTSSNLVLAFTGGDHLHSDYYASQVASVTYKTGASGSLVTVPQSDVTIDSSTGAESITLANVVATAADDVYFYATLKAPDDTVGASIDVMVPSTAVQTSNPYDNDPNVYGISQVAFMPNFDFHDDFYVKQGYSYSTSALLTQGQTDINTLNYTDIALAERGETFPYYNTAFGENGHHCASYHYGDTFDETRIGVNYSNSANNINKWAASSNGRRYWLQHTSTIGQKFWITPENNMISDAYRLNNSYPFGTDYENWRTHRHSIIYHLVVQPPTQSDVDAWNTSGAAATKFSWSAAYHMHLGFRKYNNGPTNGNVYAYLNGITPHGQSIATFGDLPVANQGVLNVFTFIFDLTKPFVPTLNAWKEQTRIYHNGVKITDFYKGSGWQRSTDRSQLLDDDDFQFFRSYGNSYLDLQSAWNSIEIIGGSYRFSYAMLMSSGDHGGSNPINTGMAEIKSNWSAAAIPDAVAISEAQALMTKWGIP